MQRQLLQIADKIPDEYMLTLLKCFAKILSREPEPAPKTPFLRAFAKISEDNSIQPYTLTRREREGYESGEYTSEGENEYSYERKPQVNGAETYEEKFDAETTEEMKLETSTTEVNDEEVDASMPKLLEPSEEPIENICEQEETQKDFEEQFENLIDQENCDNNQDVVVENQPAEVPQIEEIVEEIEEEIIIDYEPIPTEPPTVSLDDINREIQDMQNFLFCKGIKPEKIVIEEEKEKETEQNIEPPKEAIKNIEDSYKVDVCIKLKNRKDESHKTSKKHSHGKHMRKEVDREEILNNEPIIITPTSNTFEDVSNTKMSKKKQKVQALDVSWQNLCENQKRLYK